MSSARRLACPSLAVLVPAAALACASSFAFAFAGCGPKAPPEPITPSAEIPMSPGADAAAGSAGDAGATDGAASSSDPLVTVSCIASNVCSELTAPGADAQAAEKTCAAASGKAHDGGCSQEHVIATCRVEKKGVTLYFYRDKDPETTKGRLIGGKSSCANAGGTFAPVASKETDTAVGEKTPGKKPKKK